MSEHPTKSIGKGMMIAGWILFLAVISLFFDKLVDQKNNPNTELQSRQLGSGVREVVLKRNHYGHYVTVGKINQENVVFLLDTGATSISIPASLAPSLNLIKGHSYPVSTANGTVQVYATKLAEVKIGHIVFYDLHASINPHMDGDEILLGMNALKKIEMIQKGETLTLRQSTSSDR